VIKAVINIQEFKTTDDLAKLNRAYWEAIDCEVEDHPSSMAAISGCASISA